MSTPVIAALIGAAGAVLAAVIGAVVNLVGHPGDSSAAAPPSAFPSASVSASVPPAEPASAPSSSRALTGGLHWEIADNHLGTDVFSDPMGDAVASGPAKIQFGTHVLVKCWAPNKSTMGSINAFYLVETSPWKGEYAPANTFLNAGPNSNLDPHVHECPAT